MSKANPKQLNAVTGGLINKYFWCVCLLLTFYYFIICVHNKYIILIIYIIIKISKTLKKWFNILFFQLFLSCFYWHFFILFLLFLLLHLLFLIIIRIIIWITWVILVILHLFILPYQYTRLLWLLSFYFHFHFNLFRCFLYNFHSIFDKVIDVVKFDGIVMWRRCNEFTAMRQRERLDGEILLLFMLT